MEQVFKHVLNQTYFDSRQNISNISLNLDLDVPIETLDDFDKFKDIIDEKATQKVLAFKNFFFFVILFFLLFLLFDIRLETGDYSEAQKPIFVDIKYPLAIYVVSHKQLRITPDLRGRFWENQLNFISHQPITLEHVTTRKFSVNGIDFAGEDNFFSFDLDRTLCTKAKLVFEKFLRDHQYSGWLMRATHDSYINIANLLKTIKELEEKYNPMKDIALAYELYTNKNITFPHGSIILFSRKFVEEIMNDIQNYSEICAKTADDLAFGIWMKKKNISLEKFRNKRFQINWPNTYENMPRFNYYRFSSLFGTKCPENWSINGIKSAKPKHVSELAAIHFHSINMLFAQDISTYIENNDNLGIYHERNGDSKFCYF